MKLARTCLDEENRQPDGSYVGPSASCGKERKWNGRVSPACGTTVVGEGTVAEVDEKIREEKILDESAGRRTVVEVEEEAMGAGV